MFLERFARLIVGMATILFLPVLALFHLIFWLFDEPFLFDIIDWVIFGDNSKYTMGEKDDIMITILRIWIGFIVMVNLPLIVILHCMAWIFGMGFIHPLLNWIMNGEYKKLI